VITAALLGSGEFEPWSDAVDRWLLERAANPDGPVLVSPAAAAHEGEASFTSWASKGLEHYARLGVPARTLPLRTREDAHRADVIELLETAAYVFFSGGNPYRLAELLRDTPLWAELRAAMADGMPYAGCSAGVACLTERTYDSEARDLDSVWKPGLGLVRGALFGPHWDIVDTWIPGASASIVASVPPGDVFVGLDEETAMVGRGRSWTVLGRQGIHVLRDGSWSTYRGGDAFELDLPVAAARP
jgi:cyanophycinase